MSNCSVNFMAEKEQQHLVSKTFLKNFVIPDYKYPNHVWCLDLYDKYKKKPVPKGTNQNVFKIKNFYSLNDNENRLLLENFYSDKLEPIYNEIIKEVNSECNLSKEIRIRLIEWLMHSNLKTEYFRKNMEELGQFLIDIYSNFGKQKKLFKENYKNITAKSIAKEIQLETVLNSNDFDEFLDLHIKELTTKKWSILKSTNDIPFIANDNPGFSLNTSLGKNTFNKTIQLSRLCFNYFILSPKYCLFIESLKKNDSVEPNALNLNINYHQISEDEINFINEGTSKTALRYLISNNYDVINKYRTKR